MVETGEFKQYSLPEWKLQSERDSGSETSLYVANLFGLREFIHTQIINGVRKRTLNIPALKSEANAIQCSLLCAYDSSGRAETAHIPLFNFTQREKDALHEWVQRSKKSLDQSEARYVITGVNVGEEYRRQTEQLVVEALNVSPEKILPIYTPNNGLQGLRSTDDWITMFYWFPKQVIRTGKNSLLLIREPRHTHSSPPPPDRIWYQTEFPGELGAILG